MKFSYDPPHASGVDLRIDSNYNTPDGNQATQRLTGGTLVDGSTSSSFGWIRGNTKDKTVVSPGAPLKLYSERSGEFVQEVISDASGNFYFGGLSPNETFYITAVDALKKYEYVVLSGLTPATIISLDFNQQTELSVSSDGTSEITEDYDAYMTSLAPLSWWKLDEASGTVATDSAGYKNATYQGAVTKGSPLRRGSDRCTGFSIAAASTQQVFAGIDSRFGTLFNTVNQGTIVLWWKWVASTTYNFLFAYFVDANNGTCAYRLYNRSFQTPDNQGKVSAPASFDDGNIHFLAIRKNLENYSVFVDGVITQRTFNFIGGSHSAGQGLYFPGAHSWSYYPSRGYMSDFAIFEKALTDYEIFTLYKAGKL